MHFYYFSKSKITDHKHNWDWNVARCTICVSICFFFASYLGSIFPRHQKQQHFVAQSLIFPDKVFERLEFCTHSVCWQDVEVFYFCLLFDFLINSTRFLSCKYDLIGCICLSYTVSALSPVSEQFDTVFYYFCINKRRLFGLFWHTVLLWLFKTFLKAQCLWSKRPSLRSSPFI